ncbi:thiamine phosphate synthase [Candidatus Micrarchaeota archaeon]|nr:thiamine phosphate synthase [Candidatus Micrarchaeota archaeon]
MRGWDVYFITDSVLTRKSVFEDAEAALDAGVRVVQYREKQKPVDVMVREAQRLRELCEGRADFVVNDHVDVAVAVLADGLHLGQEDSALEHARPRFDGFIGVSTHNVAQALAAQEAGADYIGVGPVYPTTTKLSSNPPLGLENLERICKNEQVPTVAIGGINLERIWQVARAGATSVAMISAVVGSNDVKKTLLDARKCMQAVQSEVPVP